MDGRPCAKRGKYGGKKQVYRDWEEMKDKIVLSREEAEGAPLLKPIVGGGKILRKFLMKDARKLLLKELDVLWSKEDRR
jgi:nicotinate phosphoribosyltransferase